MTQRLVIKLFGRMEVYLNGNPMPRTHSKAERWILALLLLQRGIPVERDRIAAALWPESSDQRSLANLRASLTRLRSALGAEGERIHKISPRSLCFDLRDVDVDYLTFNNLLKTDRHESVFKAIELYRGPLLEDCNEMWCYAERNHTEEQIIHALVTIAQQALSSSRPDEAVSYLKRVLEIDPFREDNVQKLMNALNDAGRYSEITEVYRDFRKRLHIELNTSPSHQTDTLFRMLLQDGGHKRSKPFVSNQIRSNPAQISGTQASLPHFLTNLVGREREISILKNLCQTCSLISIVGAGGVGKTRLACSVASVVEMDYKDGVGFVDVSPLPDESQIWLAIAKVVGVRQGSQTPLEVQVCEYLSSQEMLLILDNCEHLHSGISLIASCILSRCPHITLLCTSRRPLGINGEQVWRAPSLEVVGMKDGAADLFVQRVRRFNPTFTVTPENEQDVLSICQKVDGIPLALELAAAQMRAMPLFDLAEKLASDYALLVNSDTHVSSRHRTVKGLVAWSYELLTSEEKRLLRACSLFAGSWTIDTVEALSGETIRVTRNLISLVDSSLVQYDDRTGRYKLLETVKAFAREQLHEEGESSEVSNSYRASLISWVEKWMGRMRGVSLLEALSRMEPERDNVNAVLLDCWQSGSSELKSDLLRLCAALWPWWERTGMHSEGREWLNRALQNDNAQSEDCYGEAMLGAGALAWAHAWGSAWTGEEHSGLHYLHRARQWAVSNGERRTEATALYYLARKAEMEEDMSTAMSLIDECLAIYNEIDDHSGRIQALIIKGHLYYRTVRLESAREIIERVIITPQNEQDIDGLAKAFNVLGNICWAENRRLDAKKLFLQSLEICEQTGNLRTSAVILDNLARMLMDTEMLNEVIGWRQQSRKLWNRIGNRINAVMSLLNEGVAWARLGDIEMARSLENHALTEAQLIENIGLCCLCMVFLSRISRFEGDLIGVRKWNEKQKKLAIDTENSSLHWRMGCYELALAEMKAGNLKQSHTYLLPMLLHSNIHESEYISILCVLTVLEIQRGDFQSANEYLKEAVMKFSDTVWVLVRSRVLEASACLSMAYDHYYNAKILLNSASTLLENYSFSPHPQNCPEREWAEAQLYKQPVDVNKSLNEEDALVLAQWVCNYSHNI